MASAQQQAINEAKGYDDGEDIYDGGTSNSDALVIEGMRASLRARRVGFVKFEYHNTGFWSETSRDRRKLESTLGWLYEAGYTCFMEAQGALAPISGTCWDQRFESRRWSNVVCAHEPRMLRRMYALVPQP